ncbi:MerR family transcriptional regulator [Spelaeicoccus albus]|uniref:DNA-binding transcriptional MerR regulator n=1 Tax=Spelaeicoccus albus TaxID=1280376 RepID=A0A7Z0IH55_9MICO|nr:MerR family transcriptional regulator [Spelaeicoccus albus]NYI67431.1 DNA-binding transcriptional MerR regulator [Spelaeicoccus albus]
MKLSSLAVTTGVSTASIKYYIHVGILPAGRKRNATTAVYDDVHVHRLALVTWLRAELHTPLGSIADLARAIDDENVPMIELMGECQRLALSSGGTAAPRRTPAGESSRHDFNDDVLSALEELGWPDISPTARRSVSDALADFAAAGYVVGPDTIILHARALTKIVRENVDPITDGLSRDEVCLQVIRGVTMHNRLLIATSALVHASISALGHERQS